MLPWVSRRVICPVHELLLGRRTFRYLRSMEESQWFSPDDLRLLQAEKLQALLAHAVEHTPFYRARARSVGVDVRSGDPFAALARLPLLEKPEIRSHLDSMMWTGAPGGLHRHTTGGSTGEPLIFYFDRRRQAYDQAARIRSHRWFGVDVGERELFLWGSPIEWTRTDRVKRIRDGLFNHRLLNAFDMSPRRMDECFDAWERFRPACLFGYPSSIALLLGHLQATGRRLSTEGLRAVFVTGEACYPHQREMIGGLLGVPIANGYGSREAGFISHECPRGMMHITAENVIVEVVGGDGLPLPVGDPGEIVVTHLDAYAMPFIRYRTGDVGRLRPGRCACGRGLPMMDVVDGRATDFLYLPDGTIRHALSVIYPIRETPGVRRFRVVQWPDYGVTVEVVADRAEMRATSPGLEARLRQVVGGDVPLRVEFVDRIDVSPSGKFRHVVSYVPRERATGRATKPECSARA